MLYVTLAQDHTLLEKQNVIGNAGCWEASAGDEDESDGLFSIKILGFI